MMSGIEFEGFPISEADMKPANVCAVGKGAHLYRRDLYHSGRSPTTALVAVKLTAHR